MTRTKPIRMFTLLHPLLLLLHAQPAIARLRECQEADFHYEYTECDKYGGRWRVAVPEPDECTGGQPPPPVRGPDCSFTCPSGTYLDPPSQKCQPCPAGTYSLGGGIRYDQFDSGGPLPAGFRTLLEPAPLKLLEPEQPAHQVPQHCENGTGWQARSNALTYVPSACLSVLTYSIKLVRPGVVRYKYLHPDAGVFFAFQVQNEQCMSVSDAASGKHMFPPPTTETAWQEETIKLASGQVLLSWKAMAMQGQHKSIKIKEIEIQGIAYAQECSKCPNGTYSREQAGYCQPCPPGYYSLTGAKQCLPCDNATEYSGSRASKCEKRPACTISDYYALHGPCDAQGMSVIEYRWIEPKICREDIPGAISLPGLAHGIQCPPCNPGLYMRNGRCHFCPKNHYSVGIGGCYECPANTAPDRSYTFIWWNSMPEQLTSSCQKIDSGECDSHEGWIALDQRTATTRSRDSDLYLTLTLQVTGFRSSSTSASTAATVGTISFVMETECASDCGFYFIQVPYSNGKPIILREWNGTVARQAFTHQVTSPNRTVFQWIFIKSQTIMDVSTDQASIYSINVTNTVDGGASRCIQCPLNAKTKECIPCPAGHYVDAKNGTCIPCPQGTFLKGLPNQGGEKACEPCGPHTKARDGVECIADCRLTMSNTSFDLTPLQGQLQAKGVEIFSRDGSRYYHLFNFTVCGLAKATCNDTVQQTSQQDLTTVTSEVCKVTVLPTVNETLFVNPVGIGTRLLGIADNLANGLFEVPPKFVEKWQYSQLFFYYTSPTSARSCPHGYSTLLVVRCDPTATKPKTSLPASCPDGTCDGCLYQIVVSARQACPICTAADFQEIVGECANGQQTIHRIPDKHCILVGQDNDVSRVIKCSEFSLQMQAAIGAATASGFLLFVATLFVWKKNQRLEYKYMKLVETTAGKEGNLPAAESCALTEGEEDNSALRVNKIVFLNNKRKTRRDVDKNGFENVALAPEGSF